MFKCLTVAIVFLTISCTSETNSTTEQPIVMPPQVEQQPAKVATVENAWETELAEVKTTLAPYQKDAPTIRVEKRDMLAIKVADDGSITARRNPIQIEQIRGLVRQFVISQEDEMAEKPTQAMVAVVYNSTTNAAVYAQLDKATRSAYMDLWEAAAITRFDRAYQALENSQKEVIQQEIPVRIYVVDLAQQ